MDIKKVIEKEIENIKQEAIEMIQDEVKSAKKDMEYAKKRIEELKNYLKELSDIRISEYLLDTIEKGGIVATDTFRQPYSYGRIYVSMNDDSLFKNSYAYKKLNNLPPGKYKVIMIVEKLEGE